MEAKGLWASSIHLSLDWGCPLGRGESWDEAVSFRSLPQPHKPTSDSIQKWGGSAASLYSDPFPGRWRSSSLLSVEISFPGTLFFHLAKPTHSQQTKDTLSLMFCSLLYHSFQWHTVSPTPFPRQLLRFIAWQLQGMSPFLQPAALQILEGTLYILPESFLQAKYPQDWKNSKFLSTYAIHYTRTFLWSSLYARVSNIHSIIIYLLSIDLGAGALLGSGDKIINKETPAPWVYTRK